MLILHDPATLLHETVELLGAKLIPALESPARLEGILEALKDSHHDLRHVEVEAGFKERLQSLTSTTHHADYLHHLKTVHNDWVKAGLVQQNEIVLPECFRFSTSATTTPKPPKDIFARAGYYAFDMSSGMSHNSWKSIVASAHLAYEGMKLLSADQTESRPAEVIALCRPPGHHCDGQRAGGYCYINNVSIAVSTYRLKHPRSKIGILDLDFHHGNGTQEIFYSDPSVFYVSIHGEDEFPYYTGSTAETGIGAAIGYNLNLPLKTGSSFDEYAMELRIALESLYEFNPEIVVISLGFDTFYLDPLGNFKIETNDYERVANMVRSTFPHIPALIVLEGGYVIDHLGSNLLSFMKGWELASAKT